MSKVRKTALVLCLGTLAISGLLTLRASADEADNEKTTPAEETLAVEEPIAAIETVVVQGIEAPEPEAADVSNSSLICSLNDDPDDLVISGSIFTAVMESIPSIRFLLSADEAIIGAASFYDDPQETASGEQFDPDGFTAAAQLEIRDKFGGIRFGALYRPAFAVMEYENKKIIVKFNDVGPLRPGRKFDLSRGVMAYLGGLEKGVLPDVKVRPLPLGEVFAAGPVTDAQLVAMGIGDVEAGIAMADTPALPEQNILDSRAIFSGQDVDAAPLPEIDAG